MKDKISERLILEFVASWPKVFSYLIDADDENKKAKGTKWKHRFEDYKNCSEINEL